MNRPVLVIGGGFAGLAAAVALASKGRRIRLLEQKPHLGGRARSLIEPVTGSVVDNGQHLLMGCYHSTLRFLETIGAAGRVRFQPGFALEFLDASGKRTHLRCPRLPAPWHLLAGVIGSGSFTAREKWELLRFARMLRRNSRSATAPADGATVSSWLRQAGQSETLQHNFWNLLAVAAMNEDPEIASAQIFERVLRLALFSSAADSRLGFARTGLSDLYSSLAPAYLQDRGGQLELNRNVRRFIIEEGACRGVELAGGERLEADHIISAVPWNSFTLLLPPGLLRSDPFFTRTLALRPAPIISINLWFDRRITEIEFAALRDTTIQWLFNRGDDGSGEPFVSIVLSGAHAHVARPKEEILAMALRELGQLLPAAREARLRHSLVIKERFATFSPHVGVEALRPTARTPVRGLYLAGDWTATGLPATIEGAAQSGYTAVDELENDLGRIVE